ncbi:unnamed protein product [Heterosigma akashiwo]
MHFIVCCCHTICAYKYCIMHHWSAADSPQCSSFKVRSPRYLFLEQAPKPGWMIELSARQLAVKQVCATHSHLDLSPGQDCGPLITLPTLWVCAPHVSIFPVLVSSG